MRYCEGDNEELICSFISKDTIREIKNQSSMDLSRPLFLADTAHFTITSYNAWLFEGVSINCSLWVAICPDFENPVPGCITSWSLPPNPWRIGFPETGGVCERLSAAPSHVPVIWSTMPAEGSSTGSSRNRPCQLSLPFTNDRYKSLRDFDQLYILHCDSWFSVTELNAE
jgi:hypothetical protein